LQQAAVSVGRGCFDDVKMSPPRYRRISASAGSRYIRNIEFAPSGTKQTVKKMP
jgi:hypothetical protein